MTIAGAANPSSARCESQRLVDEHFRGQATPASERQMRGHLASCAACRELYDRHLHLAAVDPGGAVPFRTRLARGLGLPLPPATRGRTSDAWAWRAVPAVALGICAVVAIGLSRRGARDLQARGARPPSQLLVYEVRAHGDVKRVSSAIDRDSALAFAYVNVSHKGRLLVFAVDEERHVYWYHPAWTDAQDDPVGVAIAPDEAVHEIPQAVTHHFGGHRLRLIGAFSDRALSVRDVEAAVARAPIDDRGRLALALPDTEVTQLELALSRDK